MGKILDSEPSGFANNDDKDRESITTLNYILDNKRAKPEISVGDKFPNIDGRITLANISSIPVGEIQIQVKTLPEKNSLTPKHQCGIKFLSYCHKSVYPVILIVVDHKNCCAYWKHMTKALIEELDKIIDEKNDSINVDIPIENKISKSDLLYLDKWQEIIENHAKFYTDSLISQKQIIDLRNQVQALENNIGLPEANENVIIEIHKFLDYLNQAWDHDFNQMKSFIYPSVWKFGLGYSDFAHTNAVLSIYPVLYNKNITQIKKFADANAMSLNELFKLYYFSQENPILQRPSEFAYETIQGDVLKFLEHRKLESINNTLICERVFSFIYEFHYLMGLSIKDEYKIQDVVVAITETLFQNVHKILSKNKELIKGPVFNFDIINTRLFAKEIDECLNLPFVKQDNVKLMSKKYDILKILKSLGFLSNTDTHVVRKPFPIGHAEITHNIYGIKSLPEDEIIEQLQKCFEALPSAYNDIVFINFPNIEKSLTFFQTYDFVVVAVDRSRIDSIETYRFVTEGGEPYPKILFVEKTDDGLFDVGNQQELRAGINIEGRVRKLVSFGSEDLSFENRTQFLANLTHKHVLSRLKTYFALNIRKAI